MTQAKPDKTHCHWREGTRDGAAIAAVWMPKTPYIRCCAFLGQPLGPTNCLALTPPDEIGTADSFWRRSLVGGLRTITSEGAGQQLHATPCRRFVRGCWRKRPAGAVSSPKTPWNLLCEFAGPPVAGTNLTQETGGCPPWRGIRSRSCAMGSSLLLTFQNCLCGGSACRRISPSSESPVADTLNILLDLEFPFLQKRYAVISDTPIVVSGFC